MANSPGPAGAAPSTSVSGLNGESNQLNEKHRRAVLDGITVGLDRDDLLALRSVGSAEATPSTDSTTSRTDSSNGR